MKPFALIRNSDNTIVDRKSLPDDFDPATLTHKFGTGSRPGVNELGEPVEVPFEFRLVPINHAPLPTPGEDQMLGPEIVLVRDDHVLIEQELVATPVPAEVPLWAFRLAVERAGLTAAVQAFVDALPAEAKTAANTHLEYGNFIVRAHPLFAAAIQAGVVTSAQLDAVFRAASKLR